MLFELERLVVVVSLQTILPYVTKHNSPEEHLLPFQQQHTYFSLVQQLSILKVAKVGWIYPKIFTQFVHLLTLKSIATLWSIIPLEWIPKHRIGPFW